MSDRLSLLQTGLYISVLSPRKSAIWTTNKQLDICGLIVSQPDGFRLRSTLSRRELSVLVLSIAEAVETRANGTLFSRKSLTPIYHRQL
jgi:hypothetical protein